jgi:CheY-like chemotaxis protein
MQAGLPEPVVPVRVLIADDNADSRYVMGSILRLNPGATVVAEASDGQAAIACVRDVHPDFVLIDWVMPVMDGLEATWRIKQEWPDLKVLVITSQYGDDSRLAALAAGPTTSSTNGTSLPTWCLPSCGSHAGVTGSSAFIARSLFDAPPGCGAGLTARAITQEEHSWSCDATSRTRIAR